MIVCRLARSTMIYAMRCRILQSNFSTIRVRSPLYVAQNFTYCAFEISRLRYFVFYACLRSVITFQTGIHKYNNEIFIGYSSEGLMTSSFFFFFFSFQRFEYHLHMYQCLSLTFSHHKIALIHLIRSAETQVLFL